MIDSDQFRAAMGRFPTGVTVITIRDAAGDPHGITVSAFCSLSADPPLILICIQKETACHYAFFEERRFVVNILNEDQQDVSRRFSEPSEDKFGGAPIVELADGLMHVEGAIAMIECSIFGTHDGGDHTVIVGLVERATLSDGRPLIYFRSDYRQIGRVEGHDESLSLSL